MAMPTSFVPIHDLANEIHIVNAFCREAEVGMKCNQSFQSQSSDFVRGFVRSSVGSSVRPSARRSSKNHDLPFVLQILRHPLQLTLWDVLDDLIEAHNSASASSLFASSVKPSVRKTAAEFLDMMPG